MSEWLFIDTHAPGRSRLGWLSFHERPRVKTYTGRPVALLRRLFSHERERFMQAQGIVVVVGPGSFSAIRIGVLYANLLAKFSGMPLFGVTVEEARSLSGLILRLQSREPLAYAAPVYDAEPTITLPRSV